MELTAGTLLQQYGLPGLALFALVVVIRYLLSELSDRDKAHKSEIAAERANTAAERANVEKLQERLLDEARKGADLARQMERLLRTLSEMPREKGNDRALHLD